MRHQRDIAAKFTYFCDSIIGKRESMISQYISMSSYADVVFSSLITCSTWKLTQCSKLIDKVWTLDKSCITECSQDEHDYTDVEDAWNNNVDFEVYMNAHKIIKT